jgi:hypothetical protein
MKQTVDTLSTPMPINFNKLIKNVVANVQQDIKETTLDGVDGLLGSWNLPPQVTSFLSNIKSSREVNYQTYKFAI